AGHVGAGARLGYPERRYPLAADRRDQEALLLVLGAELPDRRRGDPDVGADSRRQSARAGAGQLLGEHGVVHVVAALAAVLLGVLEAEVAELRHAGEDLAREP